MRDDARDRENCENCHREGAEGSLGIQFLGDRLRRRWFRYGGRFRVRSSIERQWNGEEEEEEEEGKKARRKRMRLGSLTF